MAWSLRFSFIKSISPYWESKTIQTEWISLAQCDQVEGAGTAPL